MAIKVKEIKEPGNKGNRTEILLKISGILIALAAFPIYGISNTLFETAMLRDDSNTLLQNKTVKRILGKAVNAIEAIKGSKTQSDKGKSFADYRTEIEIGRQWFGEQGKEKITITSFDGLRLTAYYLPAREYSDKMMILMHGYRNDGLGDFSGLVRAYHELGYNLLVPHQRSHGESEGEFICYGVKERFDLKQWAEYIEKRFEGRCSIFLTGISMGGATVLMAAGLKLPCQIKGIIADCAFTSPWDIFAHVIMEECHMPVFPFLTIVDRICRVKAGYRLKECSTITALKKNRIPVLFIHGRKDTFVPTRMSYANYEACRAPKEIWIVEGAAHGTSNMVEPEQYRERVSNFVEKWM